MTKRDIKPIASISLDLAGIVSIIGGFAWIWPPLGPILGGFTAIGLAWSLDPPLRKAPQPEPETVFGIEGP